MKFLKLAVAATALVLSFASHAATLQIGDVLNFTSASGSLGSGSGSAGGSSINFDLAGLNSLNGIIIGTSQPTGLDIDQIWTSDAFGFFGHHITSQAVTVIDDTTLDFSGWIMNINYPDGMGGNLQESYAFGSMQNIANYSYDGTTFTLDYTWDALLHNDDNYLGNLEINKYNVHLVGTVSSVPVPAAVWLFGSGLIGLVGFARRKKA